ncbi:MAG: twin-arginine translocase subunit TatA [Gammaproteobacteria bacterium]|nr:twin-arginine translocase subunit TatA [Gammaproteobacteria bacterium]|tara:strand:+ start:1856 stop:2107 length:252 start_codon:yes stop_codon:yes gene_type:complete
MGASGISVWQLLIVLLIVVLIFGTKRIKNIGGDLGGAIKSFRKGMTEADKAGDEISEIEQEFTDASSEDASEESTRTKDQENS